MHLSQGTKVSQSEKTVRIENSDTGERIELSVDDFEVYLTLIRSLSTAADVAFPD